MIVPTIGMAVYLTYVNRMVSSELWHNLAVVFWICANSVWMFGEFYLNDGTRPWAKVFFLMGLVSILYHYLISEPFWKQKPKLT